MDDKECKTCQGTGTMTCLKCEGAGKYYKHVYFIAKIVDNWERCLECGGSGKVKCTTCKGRGKKKKNWLRKLFGGGDRK